MKQPTNIINEKFLYIKNGVIFKILSYNDGDICAVELTDSNAPYITVDNEKRYFTSMEVGDTFANDVFKKTVHSEDGDVEKTFPEYFYDMCVKELGSHIISNMNLTLDKFKEMLKGTSFPIYMIKGMGHTVSGTTQINLTEAKYKQLLEDEIKKKVMTAANNMASYYDYKVTTESIEIEKING